MDRLKQLIDKVKPRRDGDVADRLNYCYTVVMLVMFSIFIAGWTFVGKPLHCWYPAYFKGWWIQYANDYCFVQNTYFLSFYDGPHDTHEQVADSRVTMPPNVSARQQHRQKHVLPYYQWVSFVLAAQAIMFYMPMVLWRSFNQASGLFTNTVLTTASKLENVDEGKRKANVELLAKYLDYSAYVERSLQTRFSWGRSGWYVVGLYLFVKALYLINVFAQFFILNAFLNMHHGSFFGISLLNDLMSGRSWMETEKFPRVTLCDFQVRVLGNLHHHTVQCVLMINMFNEHFFLFVWFWLLFVFLVSLVAFIQWLYAAITWKRRAMDMVKLYLSDDRPTLRALNMFTEDILRADGAFLLHLVSLNAGDLVTRDLVQAMWQLFRKHNPHPKYTAVDDESLKPLVRLAQQPFHPPPRYEDSTLPASGDRSRSTSTTQTDV